MKNKQYTGFSAVELLVIIAVTCLVGVLTFVGYDNWSKQADESKYPDLNQMEPFPGLIRGVQSLKFEDSSAILEAMGRHQNVPGLVNALKEHEKNRPCAFTEGRFHQVVLGVTADKTQALIGNSCGAAGVVRSFMVNEGGNWKRIGSWHEKFGDEQNFNEILDTPSCTVVDEYKIQKSIAPVCYRKLGTDNDLYAGDTTGYTYELR